ncbi:hypothetical protein [Blastococcus sp. PRF04-17]|uniref:hypothetical protein n=1 Tax=Blastococcus sp. PRF04-17 TaxID=2933797 RepID=UPI001FF34E0B|nr:hypothetical protein [Blastococcus sp. PRF04-17]UOY03744.1 hypothetical protein MVA48_10615 [Blastococcus sp. PRF04-17]
MPRAVGLLTARPRHVEAKLHVAAAAEELRAVRAEVGADGDLADALDGLVAALSSARTGPLTTSVLTSISSGLDDVGRLIQTSCDFPA